MADTILGTRKDTWAVSLTVDGVDYGIWDTLTGGEKGSNATSYTPGNMGAPYSLGGTIALGDVTLGRNYRLVRDHDQAMPKLLAAVNTGQCVIQQQPLEKNKKAHGRALKRTGLLMTVTPPEVDGNSADAAIVTVSIKLDGDVTA